MIQYFIFFYLQLSYIFQAFTSLKMESELVCFDPRDILIITNKWDMIDCDKCSSNEEDQDNANLFWKLIKSESNDYGHV